MPSRKMPGCDRDNVIIWDDGTVSDACDEVIGNIYDEI